MRIADGCYVVVVVVVGNVGVVVVRIHGHVIRATTELAQERTNNVYNKIESPERMSITIVVTSLNRSHLLAAMLRLAQHDAVEIRSSDVDPPRVDC